MRVEKNPELPATTGSAGAPRARRRLGVAERERQILDGAVQFFAEHGLGGQLRDLAQRIGVTHALLYHYFPTKQALLDRVYSEMFEGRWRPEWDLLLDDPGVGAEDKLTAFYDDYVNNTLTREFVRIFVFSGLTDHTITDRFFAMLRQRLFPRLIRETRSHCGSASRARPTARELELLVGLHGSFFYSAMRRWVYGQSVTSDAAPAHFGVALVRDRVRGYLAASLALAADGQVPGVAPAAPRRTASPPRKTPAARRITQETA